MRLWAPDGVLDLSVTALGTYEGHAAIRAFFEEWVGAYDDFQLTSRRSTISATGWCLPYRS